MLRKTTKDQTDKEISWIFDQLGGSPEPETGSYYIGLPSMMVPFTNFGFMLRVTGKDIRLASKFEGKKVADSFPIIRSPDMLRPLGMIETPHVQAVLQPAWHVGVSEVDFERAAERLKADRIKVDDARSDNFMYLPQTKRPVCYDPSHFSLRYNIFQRSKIKPIEKRVSPYIPDLRPQSGDDFDEQDALHDHLREKFQAAWQPDCVEADQDKMKDFLMACRQEALQQNVLKAAWNDPNDASAMNAPNAGFSIRNFAKNYAQQIDQTNNAPVKEAWLWQPDAP